MLAYPTQRTSSVEVLNRALVHLNLMPVGGIGSLHGDPLIVWNRLVGVHRQASAKGWYCFNRIDRIPAAVSNATGSPVFYTLGGTIQTQSVLWIRTTDRLPGDPAWPQVRQGAPIGGGAQGLVMRMDNRTNAFPQNEWPGQPILFDVCLAVEIETAPDPYISYVAAKAARELAPVFGIAVPPDTEQLAWNDLQRLEHEFAPIPNTVHDEAETLLTWSR